MCIGGRNCQVMSRQSVRNSQVRSRQSVRNSQVMSRQSVRFSQLCQTDTTPFSTMDSSCSERDNYVATTQHRITVSPQSDPWAVFDTR